jgi:N-acetyl-D-muramate 6-phosphate phosphatase
LNGFLIGATKRRVDAVLFDLDGTLIDSAPDLTGTLNDMRLARSLPAWPVAELREHCGSGARGMLWAGMQLRPGDAAYGALRDEFLNLYEKRMLRSTRVFEAVEPMLRSLDECQVPWGIVTNKAMRFAQPLAAALGLLPRAAALVAGDSTPHSKPHPAPLLEAARLMGAKPERCAYIGDDARDVQAGRAAAMATGAAAWGYTQAAAPIHEWAADALLQQPADLLHWLELA